MRCPAEKTEPGLRYEWYEKLLASLWGWEFAWFATSRTEIWMNKGERGMKTDFWLRIVRMVRFEDVDGCSSCIRTEQDDALELGDVAWHDGFILHSAGSNQWQQVRNGLAISVFAARCGKISVTYNVP